jgi:glycosyltransferase involved in cell wall biosynthesis
MTSGPTENLSRISGTVSIVVPVFNEAGNITPFLTRLNDAVAAGGLTAEIVFVNDGSTDATLGTLIEHQKNDRRLRIVDLSRNFGKEAAIMAGLSAARGEAAILIDCDLQDPPEMIPEMVLRWREGFRIVRGRRVDRSADTAAKRVTAGWFYRLHNYLAEADIEPDVGDFCLLDRTAIDALKALPERTRFTKSLIAWLGYRQAIVPYRRELRASGRTKWSYWQLWNFALDGFTSASTLPLRIWTYLGGAIAVASFIYALFIITLAFTRGIDVPGYASLLTVVLFLGGIQMITLGVIGEYVGRIYAETKQRPLYLIERIYDAPAAGGPEHGQSAL